MKPARTLTRLGMLALTALVAVGCSMPWSSSGPQAGESLKETAQGYADAVMAGDGDAAWDYLGRCRADLDKDKYEAFLEKFAESLGADDIATFKQEEGAGGHVTSWTYLPGNQKAQGMVWSHTDGVWRLEVCTS